MSRLQEVVFLACSPSRPQGRVRAVVADSVLQRLRHWLATDKTLARFTTWHPTKSKSGQLELVCELDIDGITQDGLRLRMQAHTRFTDERVMAQLEYHDVAGRGGAFERLEWRPKSPHTNRGHVPEHLRFKQCHRSQHHRFEDNVHLGFPHFAHDNLPAADDLEPEPEDLAHFMRLVALHLRIRDIEAIPRPPWPML
jgi:hypothetical protein